MHPTAVNKYTVIPYYNTHCDKISPSVLVTPPGLDVFVILVVNADNVATLANIDTGVPISSGCWYRIPPVKPGFCTLNAIPAESFLKDS